MHTLTLLRLVSCLLPGVITVPGPLPTTPTLSSLPRTSAPPIDYGKDNGKKWVPPRKFTTILKRLRPSLPVSVDDDVPESFTPSHNSTKGGDYPTYVEIATAFAEERNPGVDFDVAYSIEHGEANVRFQQTHHGLDIANRSGRTDVVSFLKPLTTLLYLLIAP